MEGIIMVLDWDLTGQIVRAASWIVEQFIERR